MTLTNSAAATPATGDINAAVYVTGGSKYNIQAVNDSAVPADDGTNHLGADGLDEYLVTVPRMDGFGRPGKEGIALSNSLADDTGMVYLFVYEDPAQSGYSSGTEADPRVPLADETKPTRLPRLLDEDVIVRVIFLGSPSLTRTEKESIADGTDLNSSSDTQDINGDGYVDRDTNPDPSSSLTATDTSTLEGEGIPRIGVPGDFAINSAMTEVTVIATVKDENGRALTDGSKDVDSYVRFTVTYEEHSDLKQRREMMATESVNVDGNGDISVAAVNNLAFGKGEITLVAATTPIGRAALKIDDWNPYSSGNIKPVRATVSAVYFGPTAPDGFDLGEMVLMRPATVPVAVDVNTHRCRALKEDETQASGDGCTSVTTPGVNSVTTQQQTVPDRVFARGQVFFVSGKFTDEAGNQVKLTSSKFAVRASDTNALTVVEMVDPSAATNDARLAEVTVGKKATYGSYTITVSTDGEDDTTVEQVLTIIVGGPPMNYEFVEPVMYIPAVLGSSQKFTIKVTDVGGNVPDFGDDNTVEVVVLGVEASYVTGRDNSNNVELDADTGEGTITIFTPVGATQDQTVLIQVRVDDEVVSSHTTMFGTAPTMPGMPMNVMAMATSHDMITVSWESPADDGGSAITGYVLQSKTGTMDFMTIAASSAEVWWNTLDCPMMNAEIPDDATPAPPMDDTDMTSPYCAMYPGLSAEARIVVDKVFDDEYGTISGTSHSDMGLMAETKYYYRVSAINSAGKGEYSDGMAMAMTMAMMMPSMELGAPSITNVMSDAEGMATVMLMPGDNATKHWVWAAPTDRSEGMWHGDSALAGDATMVTFSGLTSGMNHWFIAIAGRGEGDDEEWSAWSGWTVPAIDIQ